MLTIENVSYYYDDNYQVLDNICMTVEDNQTVAIVGTSGVGKTTLFNLISSNLPLQTGAITLDGQTDITGKVSYMLQKDMLFQHKTVLENITLPLVIKGIAKQEASHKAMALLTTFGLEQWANHYPSALSGGMRQRIAFIHTACFERSFVLLDEAFGALDAITRHNMHKWFMQYRQQMNWSTLLITHDVEEALILSDKVYVIGGKPGRILAEVTVAFDKHSFEDIAFQPEFLEYKRQLLAMLSQ